MSKVAVVSIWSRAFVTVFELRTLKFLRYLDRIVAQIVRHKFKLLNISRIIFVNIWEMKVPLPVSFVGKHFVIIHRLILMQSIIYSLAMISRDWIGNAIYVNRSVRFHLACTGRCHYYHAISESQGYADLRICWMICCCSTSRANHLEYTWLNIRAMEIVHTVTNISRMFLAYWFISIRCIRTWKQSISAITVNRPFISNLSYSITAVQSLRTKHFLGWLYFI